MLPPVRGGRDADPRRMVLRHFPELAEAYALRRPLRVNGRAVVEGRDEPTVSAVKDVGLGHLRGGLPRGQGDDHKQCQPDEVDPMLEASHCLSPSLSGSEHPASVATPALTNSSRRATTVAGEPMRVTVSHRQRRIPATEFPASTRGTRMLFARGSFAARRV